MKHYYHATFPSRVESINQAGILSGFNPFGLVFICDSLKDIKAFTHGQLNRWAVEFSKDEKEVMVDELGKKIELPKIIHHDKVAVYQIDASKLDDSKLHESTDHHPGFINGKAYMYQGDIPREALTGITYIPF